MPRLQAASELVDSGIALLPAFFSASRAAAGFARPWTATRRCLSRRRFSTATEETERTKDVVTTEWLEKSLGNPSLVVFDATWYPDPALTEADDRYWRRGYREALYGPIAVRDAWNHPSNRSHFEKHRIPGARFLDIDEMSDGLSRTPRKMPIPEDFAQRVTDMGISGSDHIIVYDGRGTLSAPRVHWLFKAFGHDKVSVLDGGLPKWLRERRAVETGTPQPNEKKAAADGSRYVAKRDQNVFLDYQRMWDNVLNNFIDPEAYQIVDARQPRV